MITELKIEGFKSFGTPPQKLQLGSLNFVVGANASGKSNLTSILKFVQLAVREDIGHAVREFGGMAEVRNKKLRERKVPKPTIIDFRMDLGKKINMTNGGKKVGLHVGNCHYVLTLDLRGDEPVILAEQLTVEMGDEKKSNSTYQLTRRGNLVTINDPTLNPTDNQKKYYVPEEEIMRLALGVGFFSLPSVLFRQAILNWRFFNISPDGARQPFKETPDVDLGPSGENLSVVLHKIEQLKGRGSLDSILSGLKGAVPGFKSIKSVQLPYEGKWAFQILEEGIPGTINPSSASDGTIRLLALMVIAGWTSHKASLIVIEEPENGLHPHLSEHIVALLKEASKEQQFIVTTHNPSFLDFLNPEEVILCDKKDGFSQVRKASDIGQIEKFRKQFRLGELWIQGTLGGIP